MRLGWLVALLVLLAGCAEQAEPLDADAPDEPTGDVPTEDPPKDDASGTGSDGAPGKPGQSARPDPDNEARAVFEDEVLATWQGGSLPVSIPQDAIRVWLEVEYQDGVYQDAGFTLGLCDHVSPITGAAVSGAGAHVGVGPGNMTRGKMYLCGDLDGDHDLSWSLEAGAVQAFVRVTAEMPVPQQSP